MGGSDERRGELGDLVDDDLGLPCVDDRIEVVGARHELEVGEDLGEEEVPLGVAHQLIEAGKPGRPLVPEPFVGPGVEGVEPGLAGPTRVGLAGGEGDRVSRCPRRDRERHERLEVASERSAREQHPGRRHRAILADAQSLGRFASARVLFR